MQKTPGNTSLNPVHHIVLYQAFNQAAFAGGRFLVAVYAVHLGASPFVLGVLVALFSFAPCLFTVSLGRLIDRVGTRLPTQVAHVMMFLAALLLCLWPREELLYLMSSVVGIGFFAVYVAASSIANQYSTPQTRAANFSLISTGIAAAQGIAPLILGFCADHLGYATAFAVSALFPLLSWAVMALGGVPHLQPGKKAPEQQTRQGGMLALLRDPRMRPVFVVSTLCIAGWDIFLVMTPIYGGQLGLSASQIGMLMSAFAIASFVVRFLGGVLSRHYTPWQLLIMALVVQGCGTILVGMVGSMPLLLAGSFLAGLGYGLSGPMTNTAIYEAAPSGRASEAMGLRLSLGMAAQTTLPLLAGSVGSFLAAGPIYWAGGLMLMVGAAMQRKQWRSRNPQSMP